MEVLRKGVSRLLGRPNPTNVSIASVPMRTALERRATRLDVPTRPGALIAPLPLSRRRLRRLRSPRPSSSSKGSSDDPLIWIGGLAIALQAAAAVSAAVGSLAVPALSALALATVGCFAGLVSLGRGSRCSGRSRPTGPELLQSGARLPRVPVLGLALGTMRRAPRLAAGWLAVVTAAAIGWALATKIFPGLSAETERVARPNSPIWLLERARAADRVSRCRLLCGSPRRASRPGLAAARPESSLYAALVALVLDVLARRCRCRDRGGRALVRDRAAPAGERGCPALALVPTLAVSGWASRVQA